MQSFREQKDSDAVSFGAPFFFCPFVLMKRKDYGIVFYSKDESHRKKAISLSEKYCGCENIAYYCNFQSLFDDISLDERLALCRLIEKEEAETEQPKELHHGKKPQFAERHRNDTEDSAPA